MIGTILKLAFGAATKGGVARGAAVAAAPTTTRGIFSFAARHPVLSTGAAVVADKNLNDGRGISAAFDAVRGSLMPKTPADWVKYGAFAMAALNVAQGNLVSATAYGAVGLYMNNIVNSQFVQNILNSDTFKSILKSIDEFTNTNAGIDIIPDEWHDGRAPSGPAAPVMG